MQSTPLDPCDGITLGPIWKWLLGGRVISPAEDGLIMESADSARRSEKLLVLSTQDVKKLLSIKEAIALQEKAFIALGTGRATQVPSSWLTLDRFQGSLKVMAAYLDENGGSAVLKASGSFDQNPTRHHLPATTGFIVLVDPRTGLPLAMIDATYTTILRTGAAGAIAAKLLARREAGKVAVLGSGGVAGGTLRALLQVFETLSTGEVYSADAPQAQRLCSELMREYGVSLRLAASARNAVSGADIVITATNSERPVFLAEWLEPGMHLSAMGRKSEIQPEVFRRCKVVADHAPNAVAGGKSSFAIQAGAFSPGEVYGDLGEIICGSKPGRIQDSEMTLFDSSGIAVQDAVMARYLYEKAVEQEVGVRVAIFDTP